MPIIRHCLIQWSHHLAAKAVDMPAPSIGHQRHGAGLARLEAHRRAGRNVQPEPAGHGTIKVQGRIGFKKMVVRADLDRPISGIGHGDLTGRPTDVQLQITLGNLNLAWNHDGSLDNRLMNGDQLGPVRKGGFHLDIGNHLRHPFHHLVA